MHRRCSFPASPGLALLVIALLVSVATRSLDAQLAFPPQQGPDGNIYRVYYEVGLQWGESVRFAAEQRLGGIQGHLVTITSFEEERFVEDLARVLAFGDWIPTFWLGGFQRLDQPSARDGWTWLHGDGPIPGQNNVSGYANWHSGEPNDADSPAGSDANGENFLMLVFRNGAGGWHDASYTTDDQTRGVIVEFETGGSSLADCNQNGVHDAIDLVAGTSADANDDGVPDECAIGFRLVETDSANCVSLMVTTLVPIRGGEVGIAYDPDVVTPSCARPGVSFPGDESNIFCSLDPPIHCGSEQDVRAGFTVGWVNSGTGELLPPGTYDVLRICFVRAASGAGGACSALRFVRCLGVAEAPVENTVADEDNRGVFAQTFDGEVCPLGAVFRRGDPNADGRFDLSDAVMILSCLFLGAECSSCPDASDTNDDRAVDVSDASFLLTWRFLGGPPPLPPFPGCDADPTDDALTDCIYADALCRS